MRFGIVIAVSAACGAVAVGQVGSVSDTDVRELMDRLEDAVREQKRDSAVRDLMDRQEDAVREQKRDSAARELMDRLEDAVREQKRDSAARELMDRMNEAWEQETDSATGDAIERVSAGSGCVAADAFVKLVRTPGQVRLTARVTDRLEMGGDKTPQGSVELGLLEISGDQEVLDALQFRVDPSSSVYLPTAVASGPKGVRFWGTGEGFVILTDAMARLNTEAGDVDFGRGIAVLSDSTFSESEPFEGVAALELGERMVLMFADSAGLVGLRYTGAWPSFDENDLSSLQHLREVLQLAGTGFFGEGGGGNGMLAADILRARCCILCNGSFCCCLGQNCIASDTGAACTNGKRVDCNCDDDGCSCSPVPVGDP